MELLALPFPAIDPVLINIGPLAIRWYALAYIAGIFLAWWYAKRLVNDARLWGPLGAPLKGADLDDFVVWAALGVVVGGRLGYILFYDLEHYLQQPGDILAVWHGGMSFHGGFLGMMLAMALFARSRNIPAWSLIDVVATGVPFGLFFGRLANFINGELWGRVGDVPWAMVFPNAGDLPRHRASSTRPGWKASHCSSSSASRRIASTSSPPAASSPASSAPATAWHAPSSNASASPTPRSATSPAA